jgi:predicted dehydrogenase
MVAACQKAGVPFLVHENWRWQTPIRQLKRILGDGRIGKPFRARIDMISGFPVFNNQPFLRELEQFVLTDMGTHVLDVARFLFGDAEGLSCLTHQVHRDIKGEDVATVLLAMKEGATVVCNMAYAGNVLEHDRFPETYIFVEAESGSVELGPDYWIRVTTSAGTLAKRYPPVHYAWADPAYNLIHASIVPCNADLLGALRGESQAETTGEDNLQTLKLVFAAYESAASRQFIHWN